METSFMKLREAFIIHLFKYKDIPYLYGGKDPNIGLDCSGLVWNILADLRLAPAHILNAQGLYDYYKPLSAEVMTNCEDLGDLIFFGHEKKIHHVGFVLNSSLMLEAAHGDASVTSIEIAKKRGAKVQVSPLSKFRDRYAVLRPNALPWLFTS